MMFQLSFGQAAVIASVLIHLSIMCVTLYLHRSETHGGVLFHPVVSHAMRFLTWLTTGSVTKQWVAVHRKHHAFVEQEGDPHSPRVFGRFIGLFGGYSLYRRAARDPAVLLEFGKGTPDDWVEKNLYTSYSWLGLVLMLAAQIVLFGVVGLCIWLCQLFWLPIAAAVINGVGHLWGYRNYNTSDDSHNILPIDITIGGEMLHNNHHAAPRSPKLSRKWFEVDIGWGYIQVLRALGLARLQKIGASRVW